MEQLKITLFSGAIMLGCLLSMGSVQALQGNELRRVIIVFQDDTSDERRDTILGRLVEHRVKRLHAALSADVLAGVSARDVAQLKTNPNIKRVDEDVIVHALSHTGSAQTIQPTPWGIAQIKADLVWPGGNTGNPIKVGIIDTGIALNHPDLKANIRGSFNAINSRRSANDDNGHGAHVAGIVAAINNSAGVVGGAHQADLYAIKVLGANGSGYLSDIIEGIDWAILKDLDVINMSLGTGSDAPSFHEAVIRAHAAGVVQVAAAGNSGGSVGYPAAYPEVIAVGATDSANTLASWSSRGGEVDLAAPGVTIYSTYKGTSYGTLSGTSMAAPHVTAAVVLLLNTPVGVHDTNGNSAWDPSEVETTLEATATDLGASGFDTLYGAGLVDAYTAVQ